MTGKPRIMNPRQLANLAAPWQPGQSGNAKGRERGSRNKLSEEFIDALYADFQEHGAAAIKACRDASPENYVKVIASLLPKEMNIRDSALADMRADEIVNALDKIAEICAAILQDGGNVTEH